MSGVFHFDPATGLYSNGLVELEVKPARRRSKADKDSGYVKIHGANAVAHADSARSLDGEIVIRLDQSHTGGTMSSRYDGETVLRLDFQEMCKALDERCNSRNDSADSSGIEVQPLTIEDTVLAHFNGVRMDEAREITPDELNRLALQAKQSQRIQNNYTQAHKRSKSRNGRQTRFYKAGSMLG